MEQQVNIKTKIIISFLILLLPLSVIGGFSYWGLNQIKQEFDQGLVQKVMDLEKATRLNSLTQFIRYYDEVLTQSARNFAYTGDLKWKTRYEENATLLDQDIKEAISLGDQEDKALFASVDTANLALIKMEEQSMSSVSAGKKDEAVRILESEEYAKQKKIYQDALIKYVDKQGKKYSDVLTASTQGLDEIVAKINRSVRVGVEETLLSFVVTCMMAIALGIFTGFQISKPISKLVKTAKDITAGNLDTRADISTHDEIGELAAAFNEMTDKLQKTQESIEAKVEERTAELEKLNKYMTGRELKMIELKDKIKELEAGSIVPQKKSKSWVEKFQDAVEIEESVIIKLQGSFKEAIVKATLSDNAKNKCLSLLQVLVDDSTRHKNCFEKLEKEENDKQG